MFEGTVSAAHGGGFASVRHARLRLGSARTSGYRLHVMGDGKCYQLSLRTDLAFDGVNYQAPFQPPAGQWALMDLPLAMFQPTWRGRVLAGAPALDAARVCQIGLLIGNQQWGAFSLGLRSISAAEPEAPARMAP